MYHLNHQIGRFNQLLCTLNTHLLHYIAGFTQSRSVDQFHWQTINHGFHSDLIPCCPGNIGDNRDICVCHGIQQAALSRVWRANQGDRITRIQLRNLLTFINRRQ